MQKSYTIGSIDTVCKGTLWSWQLLDHEMCLAKLLGNKERRFQIIRAPSISLFSVSTSYESDLDLAFVDNINELSRIHVPTFLQS
jgi:hypothetical protein